MVGIIDRFKMQDQASRVLSQYSDTGVVPRQCFCLKALRREAIAVDLKKSLGAEKAHYISLQTCGSPWACPICASKISEVRKNEIDELLQKTSEKTHVFVTYTVPHYFDQSCKLVKDYLMTARRKMKAFKPLKTDPSWIPYKKIMLHYHLDGSVTTVEVTYGWNGWHVHSHELLIFDFPIPEAEEQAFHEIIFQNWRKALLLSGLEIKDPAAFRRRSVITEFVRGDVTRRYSSYIAKIEKVHDIENAWGIAAELTKSHLKTADREHASKGAIPQNITPFGMLAAMAQDKSIYEKFSAPFAEYASTMKGSRFVFFSKGLKKKYGIEEVSDEEIMDSKDVLAEYYGSFEEPEWKRIKSARLRGFVIENSDKPFPEMERELWAEYRERKGGR